jgi:hypothetical protein
MIPPVADLAAGASGVVSCIRDAPQPDTRLRVPPASATLGVPCRSGGGRGGQSRVQNYDVRRLTHRIGVLRRLSPTSSFANRSIKCFRACCAWFRRCIVTTDIGVVESIRS